MTPIIRVLTWVWATCRTWQNVERTKNRFMLGVVLETIKSNVGNHTPQVNVLLKALLVIDKLVVRSELPVLLGLKDKESLGERYLKPALEIGLIEMTLPKNPTTAGSNIG